MGPVLSWRRPSADEPVGVALSGPDDLVEDAQDLDGQAEAHQVHQFEEGVDVAVERVDARRRALRVREGPLHARQQGGHQLRVHLTLASSESTKTNNWAGHFLSHHTRALADFLRTKKEDLFDACFEEGHVDDDELVGQLDVLGFE